MNWARQSLKISQADIHQGVMVESWSIHLRHWCLQHLTASFQYRKSVNGWWFQTVFIFHNPSHWLIFFKMVKTTNQMTRRLNSERKTALISFRLENSNELLQADGSCQVASGGMVCVRMGWTDMPQRSRIVYIISYRHLVSLHLMLDHSM